jgi:hypothetical protein
LIALGIGLGAALVAVAVWAAWVWAASETERKVRERMVHWTSILESHVVVGESGDQAKHWLLGTFPLIESSGTRTGVLGWYPYTAPNKREVVAEAETVGVIGPGFPCSEWVVLVDVRFGPGGRVISREVTRGGGGCL